MTEGKKSAIYVDIDDDITAIIEKVREAAGNIVAVVPPKRIGVLQSAVNLKLLKRAADSRKKQIFIVTADQPLALLAAGAGVAVAKSLKSEPEIAALPEDEDYTEVINGDEVAASTAAIEASSEDKEISAAVKAINDDDEIADSDPLDEIGAPKGKKKPKIPNFGKFRKKLLLIISAAVAVIIFLVWAFVFAPSATITIEAKTDTVKIDQAVFLSPDDKTDAGKYRVQAILKETKQTKALEFEATGEKTVGERATGKVDMSASGLLACVALIAGGLPAGTTVTLSSNSYKTTAPAGFSYDNTNCTATDVPIEAVEIGEEFNVTGGGGGVTGSSGVVVNGSASGGSKKIIKIISPTDLDKVATQLRDNKDNAKIKDDLTQQFDNKTTPISDSFRAVTGEVKSEPAVNSEVGESGKAKASIEVTYSIMGVGQDDLSKVLDAAVLSKISNKDQKQIFSNGLSDLKILSFNQADGDRTASIRLVASAKVGPKIDENKIRDEAVGKKSSEISENIKKIDGVQDVKVDLSPFWLSAAPGADKIKVVFSVD